LGERGGNPGAGAEHVEACEEHEHVWFPPMRAGSAKAKVSVLPSIALHVSTALLAGIYRRISYMKHCGFQLVVRILAHFFWASEPVFLRGPKGKVEVAGERSQAFSSLLTLPQFYYLMLLTRACAVGTQLSLQSTLRPQKMCRMCYCQHFCHIANFFSFNYCGYNCKLCCIPRRELVWPTWKLLIFNLAYIFDF
jgi:hypothetical protein